MFPDFSDLADVSNETRNSWEGEIAIREKYDTYFSGRIFTNQVPIESGIDNEIPELYPVGLNLAKLLCIAQADSLFGEWEEEVVQFVPRQDDAVSQSQKDAAHLASMILNHSSANSMLWEVALNREIYGGAPIRIAPSLYKDSPRVKWSYIPLNTFFPIWDPDDNDNLLEVYLISSMTREQAVAKYGIPKPDKDTVTKVEHWTTTTYTTTVDGRRIDPYSGSNVWGFIPIVYIPRMRTTHWWGDSLIEDIIRPQDEFNMRVADMGEAINYNLHAIRYGVNLPKDFNSKNYPIGPGQWWNLGRVIGDSPKPEVGFLELKDPAPKGAFDYIKFLYDWTLVSASAPPIAFGEDDGGGQRSGITLEIRMWPLVKAMRRSRAYMSAGLQKALWMTGMILRQKNFSDMPKKPIDALLDGSLVPKYAPVLPRDHGAIVDEVVKRMATVPPSISLETAVKKMGDGTAEVERILAMLEDDKLYEREEKKQEPVGMNSGTGNAPKEKPKEKPAE